jgi:hypothetical protein
MMVAMVETLAVLPDDLNVEAEAALSYQIP